MVVAVPRVRVMEVTRDEIVDVVAVRDGLVTTSGRVLVPLLMPSTGVVRRASGRVGLAHVKLMLVDVTIVRVMKMAIVEVVDMVAVPDCGVPARVAMNVFMIGMGAVRHDLLLLQLLRFSD